MFTHLLYGAGGTILGYAVKAFFGASIQSIVSSEVAKLKTELIAEIQTLAKKL